MDVEFLIHARDGAGNHLIDGGLQWAIKVYPAAMGDAPIKIDVVSLAPRDPRPKPRNPREPKH